LLADEPTGNLDSATGEKVINILFEAASSAGAALVLVTHDAGLAKRCSRVLTIEDGQLAHDSQKAKKAPAKKSVAKKPVAKKNAAKKAASKKGSAK